MYSDGSEESRGEQKGRGAVSGEGDEKGRGRQEGRGGMGGEGSEEGVIRGKRKWGGAMSEVTEAMEQNESWGTTMVITGPAAALRGQSDGGERRGKISAADTEPEIECQKHLFLLLRELTAACDHGFHSLLLG